MLVVVVINIIFVISVLYLLTLVKKEKVIDKTWKSTAALIVDCDINKVGNYYKVDADILYLDDHVTSVLFSFK